MANEDKLIVNYASVHQKMTDCMALLYYAMHCN